MGLPRLLRLGGVCEDLHAGHHRHGARGDWLWRALHLGSVVPGHETLPRSGRRASSPMRTSTKHMRQLPAMDRRSW